MKKKQEDQANQIEMMLKKLEKTKSIKAPDPQNPQEVESFKKLEALEQHLKDAQAKNNEMMLNYSSQKFESVKEAKHERIEEIKTNTTSLIKQHTVEKPQIVYQPKFQPPSGGIGKLGKKKVEQIYADLNFV